MCLRFILFTIINITHSNGIKWPNSRQTNEYAKKVFFRQNILYDDRVLNFMISKWLHLFLMSPLSTCSKLFSGQCQVVVPQNITVSTPNADCSIKTSWLNYHALSYCIWCVSNRNRDTKQMYSLLPFGQCAFLLFFRTADMSHVFTAHIPRAQLPFSILLVYIFICNFHIRSNYILLKW